MVCTAAGNFPEGFRAAVSLRGFNPGPPRFPMSSGEQTSLEEAKGRLACLLAECGYAEVAQECELRRKPAAYPPRLRLTQPLGP